MLQLQLPERLRVQISTPVIRARADALVDANWTEQDLSAVTAERNSHGAGPGAVVTWLKDLASSKPVSRTRRPADSRARTLQLRADHARRKAAAAPSDSPARRAAVVLATRLRQR